MKHIFGPGPSTVLRGSGKLLGVLIAFSLFWGCSTNEDSTLSVPFANAPDAQQQEASQCTVGGDALVKYNYNVTCEDLGYDGSLKIEVGGDLNPPVEDGTYELPFYIGKTQYGTLLVTITTLDGKHVSFEASSFDVAAAIVKGGPGANVYVYEAPGESGGEVMGDDDLISPCLKNGKIPALSHLTLCLNVDLNVAKTANAIVDRTFHWDISKKIDEEDAIENGKLLQIGLTQGESRDVKYTVDVTETWNDLFSANGCIRVENPWPAKANVSEIIDCLNGDENCTTGIPLPLTCSKMMTSEEFNKDDCTTETWPAALTSGDWPVELDMDHIIKCAYASELSNTLPRFNVATVYTSEDVMFPVSGATVAEDVLFPDALLAENMHNTCVQVMDEMDEEGIMASDVCDTDNDLSVYPTPPADPHSFTYSHLFEGNCSFQHNTTINEAFLNPLDNDFDTEADMDTAMVDVFTSACSTDADSDSDTDADTDSDTDTDTDTDTDADDCTLTQGYWRTHSCHGPAPYDETWNELSDSQDIPEDVCSENVRPEDNAFFCSGHSWIEILWTPSAVGDAYMILARQWIAATLNGLNGTTIPPDIAAALEEGETLLNKPCIEAPRCGPYVYSSEDWARMKVLGGILNYYNNGLMGPEHCDWEPPVDDIPPSTC
ncbi:MAG: hypothetical protein JXR76_28550 [Deltaproteobacteria bacterium]|nr:hypothetical protein [Deltaproteobacteria bacterium]